jgi:hypothetical protein
MRTPEGPSALLDKTFSISCLRVRHQCSSRESLRARLYSDAKFHATSQQNRANSPSLMEKRPRVKDNVSFSQSKAALCYSVRASHLHRPTKGPDCWDSNVYNLPAPNEMRASKLHPNQCLKVAAGLGIPSRFSQRVGSVWQGQPPSPQSLPAS